MIPCSVLLWTLFVLHIYWTFLMLKVLYKAVVLKEQLADSRDRDNPMMDTKEAPDTQNVHEEDEDVDQEEERADVLNMDIAGNETVPVYGRRRTNSLMGSFIEFEEHPTDPITPRNHE